MALLIATGSVSSLRCISTGGLYICGNYWCGEPLNVELLYSLIRQCCIKPLFSLMHGNRSSLGWSGAGVLRGQSQKPPSPLVAPQIDSTGNGPAGVSALFLGFLERLLSNSCWNFLTLGKSRSIIPSCSIDSYKRCSLLHHDWYIPWSGMMVHSLC